MLSSTWTPELLEPWTTSRWMKLIWKTVVLTITTSKRFSVTSEINPIINLGQKLKQNSFQPNQPINFIYSFDFKQNISTYFVFIIQINQFLLNLQIKINFFHRPQLIFFLGILLPSHYKLLPFYYSTCIIFSAPSTCSKTPSFSAWTPLTLSSLYSRMNPLLNNLHLSSPIKIPSSMNRWNMPPRWAHHRLSSTINRHGLLKRNNFSFNFTINLATSGRWSLNTLQQSNFSIKKIKIWQLRQKPFLFWPEEGIKKIEQNNPNWVQKANQINQAKCSL